MDCCPRKLFLDLHRRSRSHHCMCTPVVESAMLLCVTLCMFVQRTVCGPCAATAVWTDAEADACLQAVRRFFIDTVGVCARAPHQSRRLVSSFVVDCLGAVNTSRLSRGIVFVSVCLAVDING